MESDVYPGLRGSPGYSPSPWPHPTIPKAASVAIIGTGLSAVDAVKQLFAEGHTGPVTLASRGGRLPAVKASAADPFRRLTIATPEGKSTLHASSFPALKSFC